MSFSSTPACPDLVCFGVYPLYAEANYREKLKPELVMQMLSIFLKYIELLFNIGRVGAELQSANCTLQVILFTFDSGVRNLISQTGNTVFSKRHTPVQRKEGLHEEEFVTFYFMWN